MPQTLQISGAVRSQPITGLGKKRSRWKVEPGAERIAVPSRSQVVTLVVIPQLHPLLPDEDQGRAHLTAVRLARPGRYCRWLVRSHGWRPQRGPSQREAVSGTGHANPSRLTRQCQNVSRVERSGRAFGGNNRIGCIASLQRSRCICVRVPADAHLCRIASVEQTDAPMTQHADQAAVRRAGLPCGTLAGCLR